MSVTKDERSPAEIYDGQFVPALFAQWGPVVLDAAACARTTACSAWPVAPAL
jgi:hypothetical protein